MSGTFWTDRGDGCLVTVRLTPNARQDRIDGRQVLADGRHVLAARVRSVPEDGAANAALCLLLAKACDVPRSRVSVIGGPKQRLKLVRVDGDPDLLADRLEALGAAQGTSSHNAGFRRA